MTDKNDQKLAKKQAKATQKLQKQARAAPGGKAADGATAVRNELATSDSAATAAERSAAAAERQVRLQRLRVLIALLTLVIALAALLVSLSSCRGSMSRDPSLIGLGGVEITSLEQDS